MWRWMRRLGQRMGGWRVVPSVGKPENERSANRNCQREQSPRGRVKLVSAANVGVVGNAGSFFFPLDVHLELGTEGFSPAVLSQAVRQASKAASFKDASDDLRELADVSISPTHLQRLSERIGDEWAEVRDAEVAQFSESKLKRDYKEVPTGASAVMLDGGRVQTRADDDGGRGVRDASWRETKVACCLTLRTEAHKSDPHPEPPEKFLEPTRAARLTAEIKRRGRAPDNCESSSTDPKKRRPTKKERKSRLKKKKRDRTRVRTVVATMANSDTFGWHVAAEVHRRGLDNTRRKACVCDGQAYNWSVFEMHLRPLKFIPILDFLHLMAYLYDSAQACGRDAKQNWKRYEKWLRLAWSGKANTLLAQLREAAAQLRKSGSTDRKTILDEAVTYVTNNLERMDYPEYRRLGLPISSAPVESTIKQINRRVKGTEKFWLTSGAEAMLQLRAAQLSQDGRWQRNWERPRRHRRAAGTNRLAQAG